MTEGAPKPERGESDAVSRALMEGARFSERAAVSDRSPPRRVALWRRYKWLVIGALLFLLIEIIGLAGLGKGFPRS